MNATLTDLQLPLVFMSGLMGSAHCIGMCGPFTVMIASAKGSTSNLLRQMSYSLGRIFTYAWLGAVAGYAGQMLREKSIGGINPAAILAAVAGAFLLYEGSKTVGLLPKNGVFFRSNPASCGSLKIIRATLHSPQLGGAFLGGTLTAMLPCGLVYAMLLSAANTGNLVLGSGLMIAFGFGTVPLMLALGFTLGRLSMAKRQLMFKAAGVSMIALGVVSLMRAWSFWQVSASNHCPLCD